MAAKKTYSRVLDVRTLREGTGDAQLDMEFSMVPLNDAQDKDLPGNTYQEKQFARDRCRCKGSRSNKSNTSRRLWRQRGRKRGIQRTTAWSVRGEVGRWTDSRAQAWGERRP